MLYNLKLVFLFFSFIFCALFSKAQNETNNWFFGAKAGVTFSSGVPVAISTGQTSNPEGTSVASNPVTGALLFYSDGKTVWNANHIVMPNGTGLAGGYSSTMAALIVPQPGSNNLFYLFTTDEYQNLGANGFNYSIVDMTANGGMGDVVSKNNLLFAPCAEINHAVKHANCEDYWIIAQDALGNNYKTFLLTSSGLNTIPIISPIGFSITETGWGTGKFSPNGKKFARSHGTRTSGSGPNNFLQLFDFDILTGKLSNSITLNIGDKWYGLSFSPDNSKLYAGGYTSDAYQWDLSSEIASNIRSSKTSIGICTLFPQFQIGKDNVIYLSNDTSPYLGRINNPNALGAACNFTRYQIPLTTNSPSITNSYKGLPSFPENYFNQSPTGTTIFEGYDTTMICGTSATLYSYGTGNITWSPSTYLSCSYCTNPIITPNEDIEYIISDDNNGYGCPILKRIIVHIEYKPEIPNVFTANDDGTNDVFFIRNLPTQSKLQIYNRWGNLMLETNDYQNNWTTPVNGVYYYVLIVHEKEYKGFFQVFGN